MTSAEVGSLITMAKDVVLAVAAASAAVLAYFGLDAWRKELKGTAEYELAKNLLKAVYRVRDAFQYVRSPAMFQNEYPPNMVDHHGHLNKEHEYEATSHLYENRWKVMDDAFRQLEEYHLAAQVEWGTEVQSVIKNLRICKSELLINLQQMIARKKNPHDEPQDKEERAEERSIIFDLGSDSRYRKFTHRINAAVVELESWLRPHIRNRR